MNRQAYAVPTGLFNQVYQQKNGEVYPHEGVDFRGSEGCPVVSFIYAVVIDSGWIHKPGGDGGYGNCIIAANADGKGIYLLAHLKEIMPQIKKGSMIMPGNVVALVGGTGWKNGQKKENRWKPHLHVSYYDVQYDENKNDAEESFVTKDADGILSFGEMIRNEDRKDPFNHGIGGLK